ncbi:hypothetical protein [Sodalinema gerasimenkoae]|uniref:hypothetical protein n=1 Tax=Sodalinema gerasimenkoae TaxID=2862348 RepID=UPI001359C224|nr:hypothetical protein [Sodalinema gerasimenkoae]
MKSLVQSLCVGAMAAGFLGFAGAAIAQPPQPVSHKQAQPPDPQTLFAQAQRLPIFTGVDMTEQQLVVLRPIFEQTHARINRVLSPEQQQKFHQALIEEGRPFQESVDLMDLTSQQEAQLDNILKMTGLQVAPILTPEQREQIQVNIDTHYSN